MLTPHEASARILEDALPLPAERISTSDSVGRVCAEEIVAGVTIPPWNNASMDGYAVRAKDVAKASDAEPVRLPVVAEIPAGQFPPRALAPGEAMRIMTGAPVPEGADSVIRIEDTDRGTQLVNIRDASDVARNVRPLGEDFRKGETLLSAGTAISPATLGVLMSAGVRDVIVHRRPKVGVLGSGDELVMVEQFAEVQAGRRIVSTNSYTLPALVRDAGGMPVGLGIAKDTPESLREKLAGAAGCDLIITSAGVSVGDHDHTRSVFAEMGGKEKFWKVKIRPGAPLAFGSLNGAPWVGLSGNPVSAVVTFELFVRPLMRRMLGHTLLFRRPIIATVEEDVRISADLIHFYRAVILRNADGAYTARLTRSQSSGSLSSLAAANALLIVPPEKKEYPRGSVLKALPLSDYPFELKELAL